MNPSFDALAFGKPNTVHLKTALIEALRQQCADGSSGYFERVAGDKEYVIEGRFNLDAIIDKLVSASDKRLLILIGNDPEIKADYRLFSVVLSYKREIIVPGGGRTEMRMVNAMIFAQNADEALGRAITSTGLDLNADSTGATWTLSGHMLMPVNRDLMALDLAHALDAIPGDA